MKRIGKTTYLNLVFVDGLKQTPKDYDFSITPVLKFGRMPKEHDFEILHKGFCIGLEWGHWAIVLQYFKTKRPCLLHKPNQ